MRKKPPSDAVSVRLTRTLFRPFLPILTLFLLVGCEETTAPSELVAPPGTDDLILDQNNNGGTHGFIWLAPVVKDAVVSADLNDGFSPDVVICEWDVASDACAENQSVGFPLTLPATIEVDHYQALWDSKSPVVDPTKTYRAIVRVGLFELGSADFQFGSAGGGEVKNLTTNEVIGLKDGRTMPLNFTITTDFLNAPCVAGLDCKINAIDHTKDVTIITRDGDAAIHIPAWTLPVDATVVIREQAPDDCALGTTLPWYNSCYTYEIVDENGVDVDFNPGTYVVLEQCLDEDAVPAGRIPEVQLGAQHADVAAGEPSDFELLPSDDTPATLSCDDYVPGPEPTGVAALIQNVKRGFGDLFLGRSLYAVDKGLGGRAGDLSTVAYVDPGLRVVSFDGSRGGFSSIESSAMAPARAALDAMTHPDADTLYIEVGSTLTEELLDSHVDVAIIGVVAGNTGPITPLTSDEQEALEHYVLDGGCAILLADNSEFGSESRAQAANASLVTTFGLNSAETLSGDRYPTIVAPGSPLIAGPFGTVTSINQYVPGGFNSWPEGTEVAEHRSDLAAVVEIPSYTDGVIDGGPVIAFSDANMFFASSSAGRFHNNETLFKNSIAACGTEPLYIPPVIE